MRGRLEERNAADRRPPSKKIQAKGLHASALPGSHASSNTSAIHWPQDLRGGWRRGPWL